MGAIIETLGLLAFLAVMDMTNSLVHFDAIAHEAVCEASSLCHSCCLQSSWDGQ